MSEYEKLIFAIPNDDFYESAKEHLMSLGLTEDEAERELDEAIEEGRL